MFFRILLAFALLFGILAVGCQNNPNPIESNSIVLSDLPTLSNVVVPSGTTLDSAIFYVWVHSPNDQTIDIHRITDAWGEYSVTWNSFGGAYDATIINSFVADASGWKSANVTGLVQAWLDGTYSNFGLLLNQQVMTYLAVYEAREEGLVYDSYLKICYTDNGSPVCVNAFTIADTYIRESDPNSNYGTGIRLYTGWEAAAGTEKQAVLLYEIETEVFDGCTHTIGYWKNWNGLGPQEDMVTQYLPIWLGNQGGQCSIEVPTAAMSFEVLDMQWDSPKNGIIKLYAQLLGAKLSIADGANNADVADIISDADDFLADHCFDDWYDLGKTDQKMVGAWMETLDDYNNGLIGPIHCDDDEEEDEEEKEDD